MMRQSPVAVWITFAIVAIFMALLLAPTHGRLFTEFLHGNFSSRPNASLIALYTFEEAEGNLVVDSSTISNENLAINPDVVSWLYDSPEDRSTGIKISSNPDWTIQAANLPSSISQSLNNSGAFTLEMWFESQVVGGNASFPVPLLTMSKDKACTVGGISINYYYKLGAWWTGLNYGGCPTTAAAKWESPRWVGFAGVQHHLLEFHSGNIVAYFINGEKHSQDPDNTCGLVLTDSSVGLSFGRYSAGGDILPFAGKLYMLAVHSGTYSATNKATLFYTGLPNQRPSAFPKHVITPEDTPIVFSLNATDFEGTPLGFNITRLPDSGHLEDPNTGVAMSQFSVLSTAEIRYVPEHHFHGSTSFEFFAFETEGDNRKKSRTAEVSIEVLPVIDEPVTFNQTHSVSDFDGDLELNVTGFHPDGAAIESAMLMSLEWQSSTDYNPTGKLFQIDNTTITSLPETIVDGAPSFRFKFHSWVQREEFGIALIGVSLCDNVTCSSSPGIISVNMSNSLHAESAGITIIEDTPANITLNFTDLFEGRPFSKICWNFTVTPKSPSKAGVFTPSPSSSPLCTNQTNLQLLYTPGLDVEGEDIEEIFFEVLVEDSSSGLVAISTPGQVVIDVEGTPDYPEFRPLHFSIQDFEPTLLNITLYHIDHADSEKNRTLRVFNITGPAVLRRLEDGTAFPGFSNTSHTVVEIEPHFLENKTQDKVQFYVQFVVDPDLESNVGPVFANISRSLKVLPLSLNGTEDEELEFELQMEDEGASSFAQRGIAVEHVFKITKPPPASCGSIILNSTNSEQAKLVPALDYWGDIEFEYAVERWNVTDDLNRRPMGTSVSAPVVINLRGTHDAPHLNFSDIPNDPTVKLGEYLQLRVRVEDPDAGWTLNVHLSAIDGLVNVSLPENVTFNFLIGEPGIPATILNFQAPLEIMNAMLYDIGISFRGIKVGNSSLTIKIEDVGVLPLAKMERFVSASSAFSESKTISILITAIPEPSGDGDGSNAAPLFILGIAIPTVFLLLLIPLFIVIIIIIIVVSIIMVRKAKADALKEPIELPPDFEKVAFGVIPPLSGKDRKTANTILKPLESLLVQDGFILAQAVLQNNASGVSNDDVVRQIVFIAEHYGMNPKLISTFVASETTQCLGKETLFRSNSSASKMMKSYAMIVGLQYLYDTIAQPMKQVLSMTTRLEIDPRKMTEQDDINENTWEMLATAQRVFKAILRSLETCPMQIRYVCHEIDSSVEQKFGAGNRAIAVGGFFFLRFFCPAVTTPETYGLLKAEDITDESRARFIAVSKMIMNLAAGVEFGKKETHLVALNPFIQENSKPLAQFYDEMVTLPEGLSVDDLPRIKLPNDIRELKLIDFYKVVDASKAQIFKWLDTQHASATQRQDSVGVQQIEDTRNKLKAFLDAHPNKIALDSDTRELSTVV